MKKDVSALDNVYFKEGDGHKMTDFTDGLEGAKDVGSQGPVDNKRKSNERRPPLLFAKRRSRPPVGESPLLSSRLNLSRVCFTFLPPVGESPLLSKTFNGVRYNNKFLPPVGESPLLRIMDFIRTTGSGFYPLSGNHLY